MDDFTLIKQKCDASSAIAAKLIDEFLIYWAASKNNLDKKMDQDFARYRHVTRNFPPELTNRLKAQYLVHKIFRKDGLINRFLGHPDLKRFNDEEISFLKFQADNPWKFSFSVIIDNPHDSFYMMEDVFTSEQFLLYSPGVKETLREMNPLLWFNTIAFNGECWQSYGVIASYQSFSPDDIYFFATELNPSISDENELLGHVDADPLPYMMLIAGQRAPLIVHNELQLVQAVSEYEPGSFDPDAFKDDFDIEYNQGVYRIALKNWDIPPHFSVAYYDENNNKLLLSAMTDSGYEALARKMASMGQDVTEEPFIRVGLSMVNTTSEILRRKIDLLRYEHLFVKKSSPGDRENLDKINKAASMVTTEMNAGRKPDADKIASLTGTDANNVKEIIELIMKKTGKK